MFTTTLNVLPDLTGHLIVADALHTQRAHATYLHGRHAFYLFPVALNQPNLFAAVNALPWQATPVSHVQDDRGHGRTTRQPRPPPPRCSVHWRPAARTDALPAAALSVDLDPG